MDNEWEDLFALAEGKEASTTDAITSRKSKRQKPDPFKEYLSERWQTNGYWPSTWLLLQNSLMDDCCKGYEGSYFGGSSCEKCRGSKSEHIAEPSEPCQWYMSMFCLLRNIRCASKLTATCSQTRQPEGARFKPHWKSLRRQARKLKEPIYSKLREKCLNIATTLEGWAARSLSETPQAMLHDLGVGLIIACDSAYYDLYYLQISGQLGEQQPHIPHPTVYFGVILELGNLEKNLRDQRKVTSNARLPEHFGLDLVPETEHPLAALHSLRQAETVELFEKTGWRSRAQYPLGTFIEAKLEDHATPAPTLLMNWRDSCRDFLCHLYAYATIPKSVVGRVSRLLRQVGDAKGLIEIGAGTGYFVKLFEAEEMSVDAYDVAPTAQSDMNEYHGATPPFVEINTGGADFRAVGHPRQIKEKALLLCYPPPNSPMALQALRKYVGCGGRALVHIGEFQGLTGSKDFERYLVNNFTLAERMPCLTWGTDASEVTVWWIKRTQDSSSPNSLLLPCSHCQTKAATHRCRLLRFLNYCSEGCFTADTTCRRESLAMAMLDVADGQLDFRNPLHFSKLDSIA
jgi:hypothetical protein